MIVRNEAAHLDDCLRSASGLCDEIVVVDTGSMDGTQDIAARYGARVSEFTWCDDFAAARNASIRQAKGDWIFWLDADDRLPSTSQAKLRDLFAALEDENAAYMLSVVSPARWGGVLNEVPHARIFRNDPRIRWRYRVHEQIAPAIRDIGGELRPTNIAVVHTGYAHAADVTRKLERNLALLDRNLAELPLDGFLLMSRATTLVGLSRGTEALVTLHLAEACGAGDANARAIASLRGQAFIEEGNLQDALVAVRAGRDVAPRDAKLTMMELQLLAAQGRFDEAELCLRTSIEVDHGEFAAVDRTAGFRARHLLAEVMLLKGDYADAERESRRVTQACPFFGPAWFTLGEALLGLGREEDFEDLCRDGLPQSSETDVGRAILRAARCVRRQQSVEGLTILDAALQSSPENNALRKARLEALFATGTGSEALAAEASAMLRVDPLCPRVRRIHRAVTLGAAPVARETWADRARSALRPLIV